MQEETGEIREIKDLSAGEKADRTWSEPFHKGEIIEVKGIKMKILDIKQLRGQIVLGCYKE